MFQTRTPKTLLEKAKGYIWPKIGWKRATKYVWLRIVRTQGSPYFVAVGLATGTAISFTPFLGVQIIVALILTRAVRGSITTALLGTLFGNPWTFPFIWVATYKMGLLFLGRPSVLDVQNLNMAMLWENSWSVFFPMLIGSIPCTIAAWILVFFVTRHYVRHFHSIKKEKQRTKQKRVNS
ncbi:MAG: DUF2062 domain-containing protein [Alphaproteobacteria bacterium]|jgi:uncharacterized protein|nr:DUF2062 domain-containing protein [Alphaproteobacteria bacterium]MBT5389313.1 DUF2062 domain-containing protein [Alphaproteobacteria bacterium]MBT5540712.1 DUF2062 domain-containing protein [Alphaproteobacteria bacterium]MBT5653982.1 DUF2062 domain-containing protein [Alphaproteobacteria bacterium]